MPSPPPASSFNRRDGLAPAKPTLRLSFEGEPLRARPGETVAAALLAAGITTFRNTPVTGAARGPYCLMGTCFDCLVEIDGIANRQACLIQAEDGMAVRRQTGARSVA
jgi:predicted molibdopterin-dependent oxidoreductase YjgC